MSIVANFIKPLWRMMPASFRTRFFIELRNFNEIIQLKNYCKLVAKIPPNANNLAILGFFSASIGHGVAAKLLRQEFINSGIGVKIIDISKIQNAPQDINTEIEIDTLENDDALIVALQPDLLAYTFSKLDPNLLKNRKIIAYWVWELDTPPKGWKRANNIVHEIWTPSEFSKQSLSKIFDKPIKVLPHPAFLLAEQSASYIDGLKWRENLGIKASDFVGFQSLSLSSSLTRKNAIGAIDAFEKAFGDDESAKLVIRYIGAKNYPDSLLRLKNAARNSKANIILLEGAGNQQEVYDAYCGTNCYISLHRAEGFGLNLAEAMLWKIPLICTNWSANTEFMNETTCALVDAELVDAIDIDGVYRVKGAKWAQPNIETAAKHLKRLRNDIEWRNQLVNNAYDYAKLKLSGTDLKPWIRNT